MGEVLSVAVHRIEAATSVNLDDGYPPQPTSGFGHIQPLSVFK